MKPVIEWSEVDLDALIAARAAESIELEYKGCDALDASDKKKTELSKDVSAFANSGGGVIVYGILEDDHVPAAIDRGYDPAEISKEWIEQVINSRIHRRIDGIRIRQIELHRSNPGRVAYAVAIPQSPRAPHQAYDKRFYKRFNFESVPMEEYEVRDVAMRSEGPILRIDFEIKATPRPVQQGGDIAFIEVKPIILNESVTPAQYAIIYLYFDSRLNVISRSTAGDVQPSSNMSLKIGSDDYHVVRWTCTHGAGASLPIFQGPRFSFLNQPFTFSTSRTGQFALAWKIYAPRLETDVIPSILDWDGSAAILRY